MIETRYDPEADVLHVAFGSAGATYDSAQEVAPGVYVEFDKEGRPMGVEVTSARWMSERGYKVQSTVNPESSQPNVTQLP